MLTIEVATIYPQISENQHSNNICEHYFLDTMTTPFLIVAGLLLTVLPSFVSTVPIPHRSYHSAQQQSPYLLPDYVFPDQPTESTKSTYGSKQEISAWRDLLTFLGVLSAHSEMKHRIFNESSTEAFLILAPTNQAFVDFFSQFGHIFHPGLPVLDTLSFISGLSPQLKHMLMELVETHIISGNWPEKRMAAAGKLETLSGEALDMSMFPSMRVQSTGQSCQRLFRQILSLNGPARRLSFVDTVLVPPSIHDFLTSMNSDIPLSNSTLTPEPVIDTAPYPQSTSNVTGDIDIVNGGERPDLVRTGVKSFAVGCRYSNCSLKSSESAEISQLTSTLWNGRYIFHSIHSLLMARTDCNLFASLVRYLPGVMAELETYGAPLHVLVPTDRSLMDYYAKMAYSRSEDMKIPDMVETMKFVEGNIDMISSMLSDAPGVPNIGDAVLFHFCVDAAKPLEMMRGQVLKTVSGGSLRVSSDGKSVYGADYTDGPVIAISSHATLDGFVTPISGMLTKFDATLATLMGMMAMRGSKPGERYGYDTFDVPPTLYDELHTPAPFNEAEESMQPSEDSESGGACFPGDATVTGAHGRNITMRYLNAGDSVKISPFGHSSKIFAFTHRETTGIYPYTQISFAGGMSLTLSANHYTYADGRMLAAGNVVRGQKMTSGRGAALAVEDVRRVLRPGRFAPHSMHGDLLVNDVLVSSYTTEVHPSLAHALLAPVRLFSYLTGVQEPLGSLLYHGGEKLARWLPNGRSIY